MIKNCEICGVEFSPSRKDVKHCSDKCRKEYKKESDKEYRENNKEYYKQYHKEYRENNKEKYTEYGKEYYKNNKEKCRELNKEYIENNKEKYIEYAKEYYINNIERRKEYNQRSEVKERNEEWRKEYYQKPEVIKKIKNRSKEYHQRLEVKERKKEYVKNKKLTNPTFRLNSILSSSIGNYLRFNGVSKNRRHWEDIVGYTKEELMQHLESLFTEGMSWDNYGKYGWHIDHIIPKSFFQFASTDDVEFKMCWRLYNLQPLWATDNLKKNNKINFSNILK